MALYIDDRELVAAHQAGDGEAFDALVRGPEGPTYVVGQAHQTLRHHPLGER